MTVPPPGFDGPAKPAAFVVRRPRPGLPRLPDGARGMDLRPSPSMVRAAPGLARVAAVSAWHLIGWSVGAGVAGANYVARRAVEGEPSTEILQDAANDLRTMAWRALGLQSEMLPPPAPGTPRPGNFSRQTVITASTDDLQRRGSDLLRRSNDVHTIEDTHPAFSRILSEITPDEARILRFIYLEGPQPSIDIRTHRPLGIGSVLVAAGMNMVAEHAGLQNLERIDLYLTNLSRLGLIDCSKEQVSNPTRYQVIEAQPKVLTALKSAGRSPKLIQRSIRLNTFGTEFVRTCLPLTARVIPQRVPKPQPG
ncbi:MAG: DUF4393 domain-containing protein [Jatrophihabitans sp.]